MIRNQSHEGRVVHGEVLVGGGLRKYLGLEYLEGYTVICKVTSGKAAPDPRALGPSSMMS